jgi:apolipoprotein N-acyltransferase
MSVYSLLKNPLVCAYFTGILGIVAFPPSPLFPFIFVLFVPLLYSLLRHDFQYKGLKKPFFIKYATGLLWVSIILGLMLGITLESMGIEKTIGWIAGVIPALIITSYTANYHKFSAIYLAFLLWNTGTCYWVCYASVAGGLGAILVNPLLQVLPVWLFLYVYPKTTSAKSFLVLVAAWLTFEFLHFRWDLSWSWITLGHAISMFTFGMQFYELTGVLGGSLWIWAVNILLLYAVLNKTWRSVQYAGILTGVILSLNTILWFNVPKPDKNIMVAVIQPNIDPYHKFEENTTATQLNTFKKLIQQAQVNKPEWIILPETAIPYSIWEDQLYQDNFIKGLQEELTNDKQAILLGITSIRKYPDGQGKTISAAKLEGTQDWYDMYNAATIITKTNSMQFHRKSKLVPMVERMPFLSILGFLEKYSMIDLGGHSNSLGIVDKIQILTHNNTRVAPVICYESIYGDYVRDFSIEKADIIAIITNDGWWRNTSGYRQHAYYAKIRAIENRKYIARCANTGRSLFIDARGNTYQDTKWWEEAIITQSLGKMNYTTLYASTGDVLGGISITVLIAGLGVVFFYRKNKVKGLF